MGGKGHVVVTWGGEGSRGNNNKKLRILLDIQSQLQQVK